MSPRRPFKTYRGRSLVVFLLFSIPYVLNYSTFLVSLEIPQNVDRFVSGKPQEHQTLTRNITTVLDYNGSNVAESPKVSKVRVDTVGSSWISPEMQQFLLACGDEGSLKQHVIPLEQSRWINLDCNTSALLIAPGIAPAHQNINFLQPVEKVRDALPKWTECADEACGTHWRFDDSEQKPYHLKCKKGEGFVSSNFSGEVKVGIVDDHNIFHALILQGNRFWCGIKLARKLSNFTNEFGLAPANPDVTKGNPYVKRLFNALSDDTFGTAQYTMPPVRRTPLIKYDAFRTKQQPHPELMELAAWVRERVLEKLALNRPEPSCSDCILIIQRRNRNRRMAGSKTGAFTEIVTALVNEGYSVKIAVLEDLSGPEQVELFGQSRAVVAVHGAALTNLIWMPAGSKVVEITVEYGWGASYDHDTQQCRRTCGPYYKSDYHNLARFFGHSYRNVTAVFSTPFEKGYWEDGNPIKRHIYYVDTKQILHALR